MFSRRQMWAAITLAVPAVAAIGARSAVRQGWRLSTGRPTPLNPAAPDTPWREAFVFTVAIAVVAGVARLAARRASAAGWQRVYGSLPPGVEEA